MMASALTGSAAPVAVRNCQLRRRRGGHILVLTILAMTMLAGLVFFVYNVGDQVNRRLQMQDVADSTAVSGAGWMARSMNTVAMNNVSQARMIALAVVEDSLPLAAEMTLAEETGDNALPDALEKWRVVGASFTPYEKDNFYRKGLAELYRQMTDGPDGQDSGQHYDKRQLALLRQIDDTFDSDDERETEGGYDITQATHWSVGNSSGGSPGGSIWQAVVALDQSSQATAQSASVLCQSNAVEFGRSNGADAAFMAPVLPQFPASRGTFDDFKSLFVNHISVRYDPITDPPVYSIVKSELVEKLSRSEDVPWDAPQIAAAVRGGAIHDTIGNREFWSLGPFYRVYQWRDLGYGYDLPWWEANRRRIQATYNSYGPLEHALRTVASQFGDRWRSGSVDTSRLAYHLRTIANVKLAYLFGLPHPQKIQYADEWIVDYDKAVKYVQQHAGEQPSSVMTTRYYRVHVRSTVSPTDSTHWMETYETAPPTPTYTPRRYHSYQVQKPFGDARAQQLNTWIYDQIGWRPIGGGWKKLDDFVWYRVRKWSTTQDYELNLPPRCRLDADGEPELDDNGRIIPIPYTLYSVEWRVFGGIELRNEHELSNPLAGASLSDLPAPFLMDQSDEDPAEFEAFDPQTGLLSNAARPGPFYYLGVARKHSPSAVWGQKFRTGNPTGGIFTVAQAKLFNNTSWDMWTQDWQVQLAPVSGWEEWCEVLEEGQDQAQNTDNLVDSDDVSRAHAYMTAFPAQMAESYTNH